MEKGKVVISVVSRVTFIWSQAIREGRTNNRQLTWMRALRKALNRLRTALDEEQEDIYLREKEKEEWIEGFKRLERSWKNRPRA